jgi:hypothetical protein
VPFFVGLGEGEEPVSVGVEPEPVSVGVAVEFEGSEPDPDPPPLTNAAMFGPGKVYFEPGLNTLGSKMPGSLSLYAPGRLTSSFCFGAPDCEPPTLSWVQEG